MYELHFRDTTTTTTTTPFTVARIAEAVDLAARLSDRERLPPAELDAALAARSHAHSAKGGGGGGDSPDAFVPGFPLDRLFPGAFYLEAIGPDGVRAYGRRPKDAPRVKGEGRALAPSLAQKEKDKEACGGDSEVATTATTASGTEASNSGEDEEEEEEPASVVAARTARGNGVVSAATTGAPSSDSSLSNGGTATAAAAAKLSPPQKVSRTASSAARLGALLPRVVVTGVACGLPGQEEVFEADNLARLLGGQNCVKGLSAGSTAALVEKNVVQVSIARRDQGRQLLCRSHCHLLVCAAGDK